MEQIKTYVKRWGNSYGIVIPKSIVEKEKLKEGSEVSINLTSSNFMTVGDVLKLAKKRKLKRPKEDIQKLMDEIDKELWPQDE